MKRFYSKVITMAVLAALMLALAGCGGDSSSNSNSNSNSSFGPDLADTEWLGYRVESNGDYVASAEYVFSQDRVKYLDQDVEYTQHTGEEAYTEALITKEEAEELYTDSSFDGDEKGGFVTIILHYESGRGGLYGWMNRSMDKMELTDPYDSSRCYLFRKDSDSAAASYEENVEPLFNASVKEYLDFPEEDGYEVTYADRVLEISGSMDNREGATEETVKDDHVIDAVESSFDDFAPEGTRLAGSLESMLYLEGVKVRMSLTYKGELIGSATYDKSGEIREDRFLYGR